jgi:hypothetical protein
MQYNMNSLNNFQYSEISKSRTRRESDPQVTYGYNALPYDYAGGYYTPSLAYHNFRYPYIVGYGPRAYSFGYRSPKKM